MAIPDEREIREFMTQQVALWNAGDREAMTQMYRRYAPRELVIEYIGQPIGDGWATYDHMWDAYAGRVRLEIVELLVNGQEAAAFHQNIRVESGLSNPSIETYRFEEGRMVIRYFSRPMAA